MSKRTDVLQTLWSVVDGATTANCYLRRVSDIAPGQLPAILIVPGNTAVRVAGGGVLEHSLDCVLAVLTQGATALSDAEIITGAVLVALAKNRDLSGHATDVTFTGINEEKEQTDQVRCALAVTVNIRFETTLWAI